MKRKNGSLGQNGSKKYSTNLGMTITPRVGFLGLKLKLLH